MGFSIYEKFVAEVLRVPGGAGSIHVANRLQLTDQKDFAYSWWYANPLTSHIGENLELIALVD